MSTGLKAVVTDCEDRGGGDFEYRVAIEGIVVLVSPQWGEVEYQTLDPAGIHIYPLAYWLADTGREDSEAAWFDAIDEAVARFDQFLGEEYRKRNIFELQQEARAAALTLVSLEAG